jgi:ribonuclease HI
MTARCHDFKEAKFRQFLTEQGAQPEPATNEWELIRYRREGKSGVVYRNAKGRVSLVGDAAAMWELFTKGGPEVHRHTPGQPRRRVQLYTDASSYHATKAGAWAAILVLPDGSTHEAHGPLKGDIRSSTSAEARAVCNGLHHFIVAKLIVERDRVDVICDNRAVVDRIAAGTRSKRADVQEALGRIRGLAGRYQLKLTAEWIKGHQPAKAVALDPRVEFNRRADVLCGAHGKALHAERASA